MSDAALSCRACGSTNVTLPSPLRYGLAALAWGTVLLLFCSASVLGPALLGAVPVVLIATVGLTRAAHGRVSEPASCNGCGKYVYPA